MVIVIYAIVAVLILGLFGSAFIAGRDGQRTQPSPDAADPHVRERLRQLVRAEIESEIDNYLGRPVITQMRPPVFGRRSITPSGRGTQLAGRKVVLRAS